MNTFIVTATYEVNTDTDETEETMTEVEEQRWQMFQKKYGVNIHRLSIKKLPDFNRRIKWQDNTEQKHGQNGQNKT